MKTKIILSISVVLIIIVLCGGLIFAYNKIKYPLKFKPEIINASSEFNVKPEIIASIINAESKFNPNAVSNKGAVGLMQILPSTAEFVVKKLSNTNHFETGNYEVQKLLYNKETKEGELLIPTTNIRIGTYYFSYLQNKFNDLSVSLCAYNAGEGTVSNWLKNKEYSTDGKTLTKIPYNETNNYVKKVLRNLKVYQRKFKN